MIARDQITAVILAGGEGSRMGGVNKGLVEFAGRPLIEHVIARIKPQLDNIMISANRNLERYRAYGYPVITDPQPGLGPLIGILRALQQCKTSWLLTLPCDTPYISTEFVTRVLSVAADKPDTRIYTAHDGHRNQPLFSLINTALVPSLHNYINGGDRKVSLWIEPYLTSVDCSDLRGMFENFNTIESIKSEVMSRRVDN